MRVWDYSNFRVTRYGLALKKFPNCDLLVSVNLSAYSAKDGRSFDRPIQENNMRKLTKQTLLAAAMALGVSGVAVADHDGKHCALGALDGLYVFSATGY